MSLPSELNAIILSYLICPRFNIRDDNNDDSRSDHKKTKSILTIETSGIKIELKLIYRHKKTKNVKKHDRLGQFLACVAVGKKASFELDYYDVEVRYRQKKINVHSGNCEVLTLTDQTMLIVIDWLKQVHSSVPMGYYLKVD